MPEHTVVKVARDKVGGLFITWSDARYEALFKDIFLQYLSPDGQAAFVFWAGKHAYEPQHYELGMAGQKITADGQKKWGDDGILFMGYSKTEGHTVYAVRYTLTGDVLVMTDHYYDTIIGTDTLTVDNLLVSRIGQQGAPLWTPAHKPIASFTNVKHYPMLTSCSNGMYVGAWGENRHFPAYPYGSVFVQNIDLEGRLGPITVPETKAPGTPVTLRPNPAATGSWIEFHEPSAGQVNIRVLNAFGEPLRLRQASTVHAGGTIWLDASGLAPVLYFVEISSEGTHQVLKWMIP